MSQSNKRFRSFVIAAFVASTAPLMSAERFPAEIVYVVPLSTGRGFSEAEWLRMISGTAFVQKGPRASRVNLRGPLGEATLWVERETIGHLGTPSEWVASRSAHSRDPAEQSKLEKHVAALWAKFQPAGGDPNKRALACAALLSVLAKAPGAIGVLNIPAGHYTSVRDIESLIKRDDAQDHRPLLELLTNVDVVEDDVESKSETWIHTHGMLQFGLPEIELWVKGPAHSRDIGVVTEAAFREMVGKWSPKIGSIFKAAIGTAYRVTAARTGSDCGVVTDSAVQIVVDEK